VVDHWKLQETLTKRALKTATSSDYIECAVEMIRDDIDSDSLFTLAGLSSDEYLEDVEELFDQAMERLHLSLPSEISLLTTYINEIASRIISRETSAQEGLRELIQVNKTSHNESITVHFQLSNFDMLEQLIDQGKSGSEFLPTHLDLTAEIIKEVALFREGFQFPIPSSVMNTQICTNCKTRMTPKIITPKPSLLNRILKRPSKTPTYRICSNCGSRSLIQITTEEGRKQLFQELKTKHS